MLGKKEGGSSEERGRLQKHHAGCWLVFLQISGLLAVVVSDPERTLSDFEVLSDKNLSKLFPVLFRIKRICLRWSLVDLSSPFRVTRWEPLQKGSFFQSFNPNSSRPDW